MRDLYTSLISFILSLKVLDIIFLISVIALIILIVVMIDVIRTDDEEINSSELMQNTTKSNVNLKKDDKEPDLALISKEIEAATPPNINLTPYEEEQEERAIISYDELISNTGKVKLNYEEEKEDDGLVVKKVDLENLNTPDMDMPILSNTYKENFGDKSVISYAKEEEFLAILKKMQQSLY